MKDQPFTSWPERYDENLIEARRLRAATGVLMCNHGPDLPAVAIFSGSNFKYMLPHEEALRLANEIADSLTKSKGK